MVNSLILVKPNVPQTRDLKKWAEKQVRLQNKMQLVRYGTPKPIKGITVRMSLQSEDMDKTSNRSIRSSSSRKRNTQDQGGQTLNQLK